VYLLDTNICIDFLDGRSELARQRVRENFRHGLHVSSITEADLRVGPKTSENPQQDAERLDRFLAILTLHSFDSAAAAAYGEMMRQVDMRRSSFDRLIAAHALVLGMTLVTNSARHFGDVPGLRVENWAVA
jgi:tRNA(fMet)-specific endonuclease VapC